jgi:hypothetical protein
VDWVIALASIGVLVWAFTEARAPELAVAGVPAVVLIVVSMVPLGVAGGLLWRTTRLL